MATKSIVIHVDEQEITLLLRSASQEMGVRRAQLMANHRAGDMAERTEVEKQIAFFKYPTCICCVKEPASYAELSFSDFMKIDEVDIDLWVEEAYRINPQWAKQMKMLAEMTEQDEKKAGTSSDGLVGAMARAEAVTSPLSKS